MKTVGIIAEFNPFHNGHRYLIDQAKKATNADYAVVVMSGNFTQTGNVAIYDKFTRAKLASEYGADIVLELPSIYSNSSAEYFAFGAVSLLNSLNTVDYICFGTETEKIEVFEHIVDVLTKNNYVITENIKSRLKMGLSYPVAREESLKNFLSEEEITTLKTPNNILGIEYLKALKKLNSEITPICIKRESSDFNEKSINKSSNKYTSATSIRNMIKLNKIDLVENYVPASTYTTILNGNPLYNDSLYKLLKYKVLTSDSDYLKTISEVTQGLENKIKGEITHSNSYDELIFNLKSKRYTLTKIKRMLTNILLDITKDDLKNIVNNNICYAHVLSLGIKGKDVLSAISKNTDIPIISKINDKILDSLDIDVLKYIKLDILASNIYYTLSNDIINKDYTNRL